MAEDDDWLQIGELARRTGLTTRTLRHYDHLGLLQPSGRSAGDYRLYGPDDVQRLLQIQHLKSLGLSLDEVRAALDDTAGFDAPAALERHIAVVRARLAAEAELLDRLLVLRGAADVGWQQVLDVIALTERLRHPDAAVRFAATLEAREAVPLAELIELLKSDPAPAVREGATWAVAHHGAAAVEAVVALLGDPDPAVRLQMAHVASKLADPAAVPGLVALLDDEVAAVRAKAAFALGRIAGDERALRGLVGALGDPDEVVAGKVVEAVSGFGEPAVAMLVAASADDSEQVRERAAEALGDAGVAGAVAPLVGLLDDDSAGVRLAAVLALAGIDDDAASEAVAAARRHHDSRVAAVAARLGG
ncbi:HEAT repeat domain-containing protein [Propionibacteriaceae bacterium G57]|uniref:MerR family transcriptional regulator n=1 Tax=Aestuariimicrobium sp. G57 TaxID=3418485 RepID=UPI003DA751F0